MLEKSVIPETLSPEMTSQSFPVSLISLSKTAYVAHDGLSKRGITHCLTPPTSNI